ncbi:hypothetical protein [Rhodococcus sovatensis]|uniref:Mce-associated membrane protein n=1 Tax=Rhodococcus sovatensis TaxID=1805840 RepID=A0ABZ2PD92_9NOCA
MPPQRRKIVPPNTTSKARKKVAGAGRKVEDSQPPTTDTAETAATADATTADAVVADAATAEPAVVDSAPEATAEADTVKADTVKADTAGTDTAGADTAATDTVQADKPSLDKKKSVAGETPKDAEAPEVDSESSTSGRTRWMPTIVVGVVAALLIAFATVAAMKPGTSVENAAWVDQATSAEVTRAATEGLTALYRYNWETIDDDLAKAREYMGPTLQEQTNQFLDAIKSGAVQTQTATEVDVMDIGLTRLEADKAEVLANMNVSSTRAGAAYDSAMFPIMVNMELIDGKWVVSATELK